MSKILQLFRCIKLNSLRPDFKIFVPRIVGIWCWSVILDLSLKAIKGGESKSWEDSASSWKATALGEVINKVFLQEKSSLLSWRRRDWQEDVGDQEFLKYAWVHPNDPIPVFRVPPAPFKSILKCSCKRSDEFMNSNYIITFQTVGHNFRMISDLWLTRKVVPLVPSKGWPDLDLSWGLWPQFELTD